MRPLAVAASVVMLALTGCGSGATHTVTSTVTAGTTVTVTTTATTAPRSSEPSSTSAPACADAALGVRLRIPPGNGAAGSLYYDIVFQNTSSSACTLRGFPGVSAYGAGGRQLGSPAKRNGGPGPTQTLAPGGKVSAQLQLSVVEVAEAPGCSPTPATGLRVYPPNDVSARLLPLRFSACSRAGPIFLFISPVVPGTG